MNWQEYPKTELHIHIEGAAPPEFVLSKAREKKIDLSLAFDGENYRWSDFNAFLKTYEEVMRVLTEPQDYYDLAKTVFNFQADHGVVYTEHFLGSKLMCDNDPALWNDMLAAIEKAADEVEAERGLIARFIAVAVRHFGAESAEETATLIAQNRSRRLTGFGMAGAEDFGRPSDFAGAFDIARDAEFGLTCHAGEWCEAPLILETIESLRPSRLGHGVRASKDPTLMKLILERDMHCEVCPGSNVALGIYPSWQEHPITDMQARGVSLSISSDDPPYFATNMTRDYEELAEIGWRAEQFAKANLDAVRHSFCDNETRHKIAAYWAENVKNN